MYEPIAGIFVVLRIMLVFSVEFFLLRKMRECGIRGGGEAEPPPPISMQQQRKMIRQRKVAAFCLEVAILVHSIVLGITLSTSATNHGFICRVLAIIFHQILEGRAPGATLGMLTASVRVYLAALLFIVMTPVGCLIGIGLHLSLHTSTPASMWTTEIMESMSSGILLYSAMVEMIGSEWIHGEMRDAPTRHAIYGLVSIFTGVGAMATLMAWT